MGTTAGDIVVQVADSAQAAPAAAAALPAHAADAINLINTASSAISTVLSTAQFALGGFALILAVLGFVGYNLLEKRIAKKALKRVDKTVAEKLATYLGEEQFRNMVDVAVEANVQRRFANAIIVQQQAAAQAPVAGPVPREVAQ